MPSLHQARRFFLGAAVALVALDLLAAAYAFLPQTSKAPVERYRDLQQRVAVQRGQAIPYENIGQKIVTARQQIEAFYKDRLPGEPSSVLERVGKLAHDHNVALRSVHYTFHSTAVSDLRSMEMEASIDGSYTSVAKFINSLERDPMLFVVKSVRLNGEQQGRVGLQLSADTYLKMGPES